MRSLPPALLVLAILLASSLTAQTVPSAFVVETVTSSGIGRPHCLAMDPLGRIFVGAETGQIRSIVGGSTQLVGTVPNIESGGEKGLLSLVFDPDFAINGQLYVWCARTTSSSMEVLRYTCTGDLANPLSGNISFVSATERVIIDSAPDFAFNHNGGTLLFSPIDGMLLLSIGDDANCASSQNAASLAGVLVRMDVSGLPAGPSATAPTFAALDPGDNPNSGSGSASAIILDIGLRNPWRMTQDVIDGDLYIADVGAGTIEEFNRRAYTNLGTQVNFGWPYKEGTLNFGCGGFNGSPPGLTDPIVQVNHSAGWFSGMAGFFYRHQPGASQTFGGAYDRVWFYSDYFAGELRALMDNGNGTWSPLPPVAGQPSPTNWGTGFNNITQAVLHLDGSVYFIRHNGGGGTLGRIRPVGPIDVVTVTNGDGQVGLIGETFLDPVRVNVTDSQSGQPLVGVSVTFSVSGGAIVGGPANVMTDANGDASVMVQATGAGPVGMQIATGNMGGATANLFARGFTVSHVNIPTLSDIVLTDFVNTSQLAQVPLVLALSLDTVPIFPLPIGDVCVDLFGGVDTIIFEDAFSGLSSHMVPPFGTPGRLANYFGPSGSIPPGTYRFQCFWDDPTTLNSVVGRIPFRIGVSNCVTVVVP